MNVYDQPLLMEFPGIETTLTDYSRTKFASATMLLPSLKQALTEHDKERTLYCLERNGWLASEEPV
ncbi:MAG: hypothetical protein ACLVJH_09980 [Faecalibacterium prausnitzii]